MSKGGYRLLRRPKIIRFGFSAGTSWPGSIDIFLSSRVLGAHMGGVSGLIHTDRCPPKLGDTK